MDTHTSIKSSDRTYVVWFLVLFFVLCVVVLMFKRTDYFPWVGGCSSAGYDADHYLAYCHSVRYGDYEYYAFWHDTESEQINNLSKAEVLFLGNSRTQFAFSTKAVDDFFRLENIPFFVFGFGLGGKSQIPLELIQKHDLKPKALVINADPFFSPDQSKTLNRVKLNDRATRWEHSAKVFLQKQQQRICNSENKIPLLFNAMCTGDEKTLFRSRETGFWRIDYYLPDISIPIGYDDSLDSSLDSRLSILEEFITLSGVPRECVILTVTPQSETPLSFAKTLAARAKLPAHFPDIDNLATIDESHLNKISAQSWSEAFLKLAAEDLKRCSS